MSSSKSANVPRPIQQQSSAEASVSVASPKLPGEASEPRASEPPSEVNGDGEARSTTRSASRPPSRPRSEAPPPPRKSKRRRPLSQGPVVSKPPSAAPPRPAAVVSARPAGASAPPRKALSAPPPRRAAGSSAKPAAPKLPPAPPAPPGRSRAETALVEGLSEPPTISPLGPDITGVSAAPVVGPSPAPDDLEEVEVVEDVDESAATAVAVPMDEPALQRGNTEPAPAKSESDPPPLPGELQVPKVPPLAGARPVVSPVVESPAGLARLSPWPVNLGEAGEDPLDAAPTHFDVGAKQRHASPWTEERRDQEQKQNAQKLVDLFEAELNKPIEKSRRARLHYEAARLYECPLGDLEAASRHYEQAIKLTRTHVPSVRGARRVLLALKRHKQAVKLFDAELELTTDPTHKAMLSYEKSMVMALQLGQKNEAREALRQAVALSPTTLTIAKTSAWFEEQTNAWDHFVRAVEHAANATHHFPRERAAFLTQAARAVAVHLRDADRAIELYKVALEVDARAPGAIDALKELLYGRRRWKELVEVLEREAELATTDEARAYLKFRAARVLIERLSDVHAGIAALEQAAALTPNDLTILEELLRIYELQHNDEQCARIAESIVALEEPSIETLQHLAEIYEQRLNQPELAMERLSQVLQIDPAYRPALLALGRLREQRGEWPQLVEMLNREAEASADAEHRAALHARMADICEQHLGSEEYAVEHHKRALALRPGYEPSYKALVRLHTAAGRWHELIELYERGFELASSREERVATLFSIGRLQEDALHAPQNAVRSYQRLIELDADNLEAITALQRASERAGEHRVLVEALEMEVARTEQRPRVLVLKHRAATILEQQLGETDAAISKLKEILESDRSYIPALESLARLYYRDGRHQELLKVYEQELSIMKLADQRAKLLVKMAELCANELNHAEHAVSYYRKALAAEADYLPAIRGLRRLLSQNEQYDQVAQLLGSEGALLKEPSRAARLFFLQGEILENRLQDADKALTSYRKALELAPGFQPALDGIVRLLEQKRDYKQLDDALGQQVEALGEPFAALNATYRRAEMQRDHLRQLKQAAEGFEAVLESSPAHVGAWLALERLHFQADDAERLGLTYQQQSQGLESPAGRVAAIRGSLQLLLRESEPDPARAKEYQSAILRLVPNDLDALFGLERAAIELGDTSLLSQLDAKLGVANLDRYSVAAYQTRLAEAMEARGDNSALQVFRAALKHDPENLAAARGISRVAERTQSPPLLAEAAENEARLLERPDSAARLLVVAASRLSAAGDLSGAVEMLSRALHVDPDHAQAAEAMISLLARGISAERAIDVLSQAAAKASGRERRASLWTNVAQLQRRYRQDVGAAIAAAQRAIREQPNAIEAHVLLARLFAATRRWKACAEELQELLKLNPPQDVRFDALLQLAAVQFEHLKATALAASNVTAALALNEGSREGLELLLKIQISREQLDEAAETAQRLVETSTSAEQRAQAWFHSAKLERHRKNAAKVVQAYAGAVSILGPSGDAGAEFKAFLEQSASTSKAEWRAFADALEAYLQRADLIAEQRLNAHQELAQVLYDRLDERHRAVRELQEALELAPASYQLRQQLAERLEGAGQYREAIGQYYHLLVEAPHILTHWRSISGCYAGMMRTEQSRLALAPLVASGEATAQETSRYQSTSPQDGSVNPGSLDLAALQAMEREATVSGPVVDLLEALQPALLKLYPVEFERFGITSRDKITARTAHPLRELADRIAAGFGLEEFDMYIHQSSNAGLSVQLADQPALFVHAQVAQLSRVEQVFLLARALSNLARGTYIVDLLSPQDVELVLVSAARNYDASIDTTVADAAVVSNLSRRISRAMPWFKGNRLEPAARSFAVSDIDVGAWVVNAQVAAARAATLVADDLAACIRLLSRGGFDDAFIGRVSRFIVSDEAAELRSKVFA